MLKTLNEVREITRNWIREYNEARPIFIVRSDTLSVFGAAQSTGKL